MTTPAVTYASAKAAAAAAGFPVSAGNLWTGVDENSYQQLAKSLAYNSGTPLTQLVKNQLDYGFAYPSEMPGAVSGGIAGSAYAATLAGTPLTGAHPLSVTWTLTETAGGPADSYLWDFGDGTTTTVTTNAAQTHSYAAAGSFRAKVTPSFKGVAAKQIVAAAPAVVS